jgi:hypothetical protein
VSLAFAREDGVFLPRNRLHGVVAHALAARDGIVDNGNGNVLGELGEAGDEQADAAKLINGENVFKVLVLLLKQKSISHEILCALRLQV